MLDIIEKMKTEMFRRKYSIRTIKSYCDVVRVFLKTQSKSKTSLGPSRHCRDWELNKNDLRRITKAESSIIPIISLKTP